MPTIKEKIRFNYDGKWSDEFGLMHVVLDSGMFEETFVASRDIVETENPRTNKPFFNKIKEAPLEFDMVLAFENGYDDSIIDKVVRWLFGNYYKPLYFDGADNKVFYCTPISDSSIVHTGFNKGYFTIKMRCDSSNIYKPVSLTDEYDLSDIDSKIIDIYNEGHYTIYPEISIDKIGDGKITIISKTDGDNIFEILDLADGESLYINCEKEMIETDVVGLYRYNNVLGEYPRLTYGRNTFEIQGNCKIQFRYQVKFKF